MSDYWCDDCQSYACTTGHFRHQLQAKDAEIERLKLHMNDLGKNGQKLADLYLELETHANALAEALEYVTDIASIGPHFEGCPKISCDDSACECCDCLYPQKMQALAAFRQFKGDK